MRCRALTRCSTNYGCASAAGTGVELAVLPLALLQQSLPGHDPGTTQPRAGIAAVRDLLEQMDGAPGKGLDRP